MDVQIMDALRKLNFLGTDITTASQIVLFVGVLKYQFGQFDKGITYIPGLMSFKKSRVRFR